MLNISIKVLEQTQTAVSVAPKRYVLLLLKSFSAFDLITVIEALKEANQVDKKDRYQWCVISEDGQAVTASNDMVINVDDGLINIERHDTLIVFGGDAFASASTLPILAWLRRQARNGPKIGAISSAAFTLTKAGLLNQNQVATHWSYHALMQETFDDADVNRSIFYMDDMRFTCAGGVATLDLMLQLISREQGELVATSVADNMVCSMPRTGSHVQVLSRAVRVGQRNDKVAEAISTMQESLEFLISPADIAREIGISPRQLERLFKKYLNDTPKSYYVKLRVEHARSLLLQTDMKIIEIALACGFGNVSHFSKIYKKNFGLSPFKDRGFGASD